MQQSKSTQYKEKLMKKNLDEVSETRQATNKELEFEDDYITSHILSSL